MNSHEHEDDPLQMPPLVAVGKRATVLDQTIRILRRRRRWRRAMYALSLAGCYLAGAVTISILRPAGAEGQSTFAVGNPPLVAVEPSGDGAAEKTIRGSVDADTPVTQAPVAAARKDIATSPFASYCALGDMNLIQRRDPEAAARAYRVALRFANDTDRTWVATEGTWLLRAIHFSLASHTDAQHEHKNDAS